MMGMAESYEASFPLNGDECGLMTRPKKHQVTQEMQRDDHVQIRMLLHLESFKRLFLLLSDAILRCGSSLNGFLERLSKLLHVH